MSPGLLINHGGPVQTAPQVYVDFWGWTSDPSGEQSYLTHFLSSVGGNPWLATVDQYGGDYSGNLLAGTWSDNSSIPANPTDAQIQQEAAAAVSHFGAGVSVNVQIVVATPTGHSTSGFGTNFCAYHGTLTADPDVTYTNLPYMTDAGRTCGENTVNPGAAGLLDGVSIVEGHELAETITDPLLNAWFDANGMEIGDKCVWTNLADITTSAGTFAVQPLWSNAVNGCALNTPASTSPNLLTSGSFEGSVAGWNRLVPPGATVTMTNYNTANGAPAPAHDGTGYLAVSTDTTGSGVYQNVPVSAPAGTSYVATAWMSAQSGTATGFLCAWGVGTTSTSNCSPYTATAGSYTQVQVVYDAPVAITTMRFLVYPTPNGGITDLDTASLVQSLLTSGSFEGSAAGWHPLPNGGGTVNMVDYNTKNFAPAPAQDGNWYLAFNSSTNSGSVYQDVPVNAPAGTSYVATAWLSAQSGNASGTLCVWGLGTTNTHSCIPYAVNASAYTPVQVVYDAPVNITTLRFQIYTGPSGGTTDLDTASVVQSLLKSGSFEGSAAGWNPLPNGGGSVAMVDYNTANGAPAPAHDGSWYLAFNSSTDSGSVYQDVPVNVPAGTSYVATAWLSAQSGNASGTLCVWGLGTTNTHSCIPYSVNASAYTPVQVVYDAPVNITTLRFQIYTGPSGGTTDLDTASVG